MANIEYQLSYLHKDQCDDIIELIRSYPTLCNDVPSRTNILRHDFDVGSGAPIKQHAYRCLLIKREIMKREVEYLLENGLAKPSHSPWSSLYLLAPNSDGTPLFCPDFHKVNAVTVTDSFPLPCIDDCIDSIVPTVVLTRLDMLRGYWQLPLIPRASEISVSVTPDHFLQYTVIAFWHEKCTCHVSALDAFGVLRCTKLQCLS